ncbi:MAG: uroporphyrinogen decarboxylase family protein [Anaerolineales bacterium]|jgi:uroporphyrinogen decarboxylase
MDTRTPSKQEPITSRQRVLAALDHKQPDRVPRDLGGTTATSVNIVAYRNLIEHLELDEDATLFSDRVRLANLSEEILDRFKIDTRPLIVGGGFGVGKPNPDGTFTDGYGIVRSLPDERGHWYVVKPPLSGPISKSDVASAAHNWPDPADPIYTDGLAERASKLHQETEYAIVLTLPIGSIHVAQWLRGFDEWLMDSVTDPDLSIYLLDLLLERWLDVTQRLLEVVGSNVDVLFYAEDIAFHKGPMVSPRTYEQIIHPYQKRVFRFLKDNTHAKLLYHNCGSVTWQIPDLIEMGVDALNPVQVTSYDMGDTASLKQRFGERIAFWGGVDTGHVLPQGTTEDVHAEVQKRVVDLSRNGGYVLASVHNIQADVPPQNICAIWDAADCLESK